MSREPRKGKRLRRLPAVALALVLALTVAACGEDGAGGGGGGEEATKISIAYQPGIGYAPLLLAKQEKWLEQGLPGVQIEWRQLDSGAAIRDGILSGDIQVGSGGLGPFLVGWAKGIDWKIISTMENMDLWLMAKDEKYQTLEDFKDGGKIAMPAPDSIQAVVLRRAAENELGDATALDENIVSLGHPDGLQALLSGQLAGHLTSPPFEFQEQDKGARQVITSYDAFGGPHTFNSVFMREGFHDSNPKAADVLVKSIARGVAMLRDEPKKAAAILSEESGGANSAKEFEDYITNEAVEYTTEPNGFVKIAQFMKEIELIEKAPEDWKELVFDNLAQGNGS